MELMTWDSGVFTIDYDINDSELMTRHSTNDTELFRKMTSLILMDKISPFGRCLMLRNVPP